MGSVKNMISNILPHTFSWSYVLEILILTVLIYQLLKWIMNTRAWTLLKGIIVVLVFAFFAYVFRLTTISFILSRTVGVLVTAVIIVFQPELRRALEQLGQRNILFSILGFGNAPKREEVLKSSDKINAEIVKAVYEMSKAKTGALIIMDKQSALAEYERTGIILDALVSSQLLVNIFEKNTPLHDGAVFIRNQRIVAATCYLPLSDNMELSKDLGTRHRAGVGISEVSDTLTIIVSEETGDVSLAEHGKLTRHVRPEDLKARLSAFNPEKETDKLGKLKVMIRNEKKAD